MISVANTELICDFAETYHIYDYQALPVQYAATLAIGLGDNSRTKIKLRDQKVPTDTLLLATIADRLSLLVWFQTEDGHKNRNRPKSFLDALLERKTDNQDKVMAFSTGEELEAALAKFRKE